MSLYGANDGSWAWVSLIPHLLLIFHPDTTHLLGAPVSLYGASAFYLDEFLKFIYSKKATKFCEIISTLDLSYVVPVKSKVEITQNFLAFLEYMNFKNSSR